LGKKNKKSVTKTSNFSNLKSQVTFE